MKRLLLLFFLFLSLNSFSQRYAIIDRKLKTPLQFVDNIPKGQLDNGFFAVEKQNIGALIAKLDSLSARLRNVVREKYDEDKIIIGTTVLSIKVIKQTFGDRLNISLSTDTDDGYDKSFYIVDAKLTNNDNARYLNRLINYLKK